MLMLPPRETDDPEFPEHSGYRGKQIFQTPETRSSSFSGDEAREKIFPTPRSHQNLFRFAIAALSMITLIALVVICLGFIGGLSGWISFAVGGCVILGVAITTTNGTK